MFKGAMLIAPRTVIKKRSAWEKFEDTKGIVEGGQSIQFINEKRQKTNNGPTHYTKNTDWATETPLKTCGELWCSNGYAVPAPLVTPVRLLVLIIR